MKKSPVVIITGAAGGIGKATALRFAAEHFALALVDINRPGLHALTGDLDRYSCEYILIDGDLGDILFVKAIIEQTILKWGRIDVLVNNAAWRTIETMRSITYDAWEKTIKINLTAPAFLAKHAAVTMEENEIPGVIINISSVMSGRAGGNSPAYIMCKGGIESLTYELAVLYGPKGIRVIAVNPGNIQTNLSNDFIDDAGNNVSGELGNKINDSTPLQRSGAPEEVANVSYWLSTDEASFITGTSIIVDGGFFHNFNSYQMKKIQFPKEF